MSVDDAMLGGFIVGIGVGVITTAGLVTVGLLAKKTVEFAFTAFAKK